MRKPRFTYAVLARLFDLVNGDSGTSRPAITSLGGLGASRIAYPTCCGNKGGMLMDLNKVDRYTQEV